MFKSEFAPLVKAGIKRQTIRPTPKRMPKIGDLESWREWSDKPYRSPQIELAQVRIIGVDRFRLTDEDYTYGFSLLDRPLRGALMPAVDWEAFSKADGFDSMFKMAKWFEREHGLPFEGIVINAEDYKPNSPR